MSFDIGLNFRQTSTYVTDPANCSYVLAENYPTTRDGRTFGWVSSIGSNARNRNSALDPRLAGIAYQWGGDTTKKKFRLDLPSSGDVDIYCAIGDAGGANYGYLEIFDDSASLGVLVASKLLGTVGTFYDAADTGHTSANWPTSNAKTTLTFSSTTLIAAITPGDSTSSNFAIAHLRAVQAAATGYTLTADAGALLVTGPAAGLEYGRLLSAVPGSFAVSGIAATLKRGYSIPAGSGSAAATGTNATLKYGRVLPCNSGPTQITGIAASLEQGRLLSGASGSLQISGSDATLTYATVGSFTLVANPGSFQVGGSDTSLEYGRRIQADTGSLAFAGTTATLRYAHQVIAEAAAFAITGVAATFIRTGGPEPISSTVERIAVFRVAAARIAVFRKAKQVSVRFN